jgi:hypothetical protein
LIDSVKTGWGVPNSAAPWGGSGGDAFTKATGIVGGAGTTASAGGAGLIEETTIGSSGLAGRIAAPVGGKAIV